LRRQSARTGGRAQRPEWATAFASACYSAFDPLRGSIIADGTLQNVWQVSGNFSNYHRFGDTCFARRAALGLGADGGTRTRTALSGQRILSPLRLPFRHIGLRREVARNQAAQRNCASANSTGAVSLGGNSSVAALPATTGLSSTPSRPGKMRNGAMRVICLPDPVAAATEPSDGLLVRSDRFLYGKSVFPSEPRCRSLPHRRRFSSP
jgi:hypothetical protein